ncbi:hypothetical protein M5K25_017673 [Dendrobium thyrsiflorum]|uniref:Uncharacterized protein n=1 Tax=Dendrobium thyrsiflorum TaxID=117978 RepID=A0ABD0UMV7_DENTH
MAAKKMDALEGEMEQLKAGVEEKYSRVEGRLSAIENRFRNFEEMMKKMLEMQSKASPIIPRVEPRGKEIHEDDDELCIGPFPAGVILHSFMGSAEMVPAFTQLGSYFSFSGFLTSMKTEKAKKMLKSVPIERILFESDAPDAFPKSHIDSSSLLVDNSIALGHESPEGLATSAPNHPKEELNHPANIQIVLNYVAKMLDVSKEGLAEASYQNAIHLFSYPGSKLHAEI